MRPWLWGSSAASPTCKTGLIGCRIGPPNVAQIAKDVMVELDLKKLTAPDFTASIRDGMPALMVINEDAVPSIYWAARRASIETADSGA